jgi:hypothetical protein
VRCPIIVHISGASQSSQGSREKGPVHLGKLLVKQIQENPWGVRSLAIYPGLPALSTRLRSWKVVVCSVKEARACLAIMERGKEVQVQHGH